MAEQLKAVIRAEVDPSGVVTGVNRATAELQRLNQTASRGAMAAGITASLNTIQVAYGVVSSIVGKLNERAKSLTETTTKYDLAAANAKTRFEVEQIKANKRIAAALSPAVQESYRIQTQQARSGAARVERMRGVIGEGIVGQTKTALAAQSLTNQAADIGGGALGAVTNAATSQAGMTALSYSPTSPMFGMRMALLFKDIATGMRSPN
jgi:hypothetical protein